MDRWIPTPVFDAAVEWFRSYRETEEFREGEVYYKASLRAILTAALTTERLEGLTVRQWLLDLVDGKLGPDELGLGEPAAALLAEWPYRQSWYNLNGGKWAAPIFSAFRAWIEGSGEDELRATLSELLRGTSPAPARVDAFCRHISARFKELHAEGRLRTKRAPSLNLGFAASILGIVEPETATLWRAGEYARAASAFGLQPPNGASNEERYAASIAMQSQVRDEFRARGIPVQSLLEVHDFIWVWSDKQKAETGVEERWWLFQAVPDRYDIDGALRDLDRLPWTVTRYGKDIHAGHRVFVYRAGAEAAVVAVATITSDPGPITGDVPDRAYERGGEVVEQRQDAVWLDIDVVFDTPLPRLRMLEDDVLKGMLNLRQPAGTNFPVEPDEATRLLELLGLAERTFDEAWHDLVGWAAAHGFWTTLARGLGVRRLEATEAGIRYTVGGPNSRPATLTRAAAERAWNAVREDGSSGVGHITSMPKGLLARMPNIEYDLNPMRLVWASPGSHPLGTIKRVGMPAEDPTPAADSSGLASTAPIADLLHQAVDASGLWFEPEIVDAVYMALRAKPFLIITGLSGTGKTKVALALQRLLSDEDAAAFISVRPDWIDGKSLFGYHNLLTDTFTTTELTRLLLHADREFTERGAAASPHILILDEMNLARVEHYFSDYLSVLESRTPGSDGEPIRLHSNAADLPAAGDPDLRVPASVRLAPNVYVVGTVNVDETTHPFSRKVLDRANVIELFDVDLKRRPVDEPVELALEDGDRVRRHFTRGGSFIGADAPDYNSPWLDELVRVNKVLERDRLHFGYRARNEILAFVEQAGDEGLLGSGASAAEVAFDLQLLQKVLPKLAGSKERLARPLTALLGICLGRDAEAGARAKLLAARPEALYAALSGDDTVENPGGAGWPLDPSEARYPRTARKIARMLRGLQDEGYTSFFE